MFQIKNRFTGAVQFECELPDEIKKLEYGLQLGFAIKEAIKKNANLSSANLSNANLSSASLRSADLCNANLRNIKEDFFTKLTLVKGEALGLYDFLMKGKIDGSCYEGECACFVGTIAKVCGQQYNVMTNGITPAPSSPTERWFLAIKQGDIPQNNQVSGITAGWMREFMDKEGIKYPAYEIVAINS